LEVKFAWITQQIMEDGSYQRSIVIAEAFGKFVVAN
jgi:hypothetical protein